MHLEGAHEHRARYFLLQFYLPPASAHNRQSNIYWSSAFIFISCFSDHVSVPFQILMICDLCICGCTYFFQSILILQRQHTTDSLQTQCYLVLFSHVPLTHRHTRSDIYQEHRGDASLHLGFCTYHSITFSSCAPQASLRITFTVFTSGYMTVAAVCYVSPPQLKANAFMRWLPTLFCKLQEHRKWWNERTKGNSPDLGESVLPCFRNQIVQCDSDAYGLVYMTPSPPPKTEFNESKDLFT